jgi:hypothetical protein
MSQETEKEDPRLVPPKRFADKATPPKPGGMQDDKDDALGAVDDEEPGTMPGGRGKSAHQGDAAVNQHGEESSDGDDSDVGSG